MRIHGVSPHSPGRTNRTFAWTEPEEMAIFPTECMNAQVCKATPLQRPAEPEEIAGAVTFFALQASSFCTGQVTGLPTQRITNFAPGVAYALDACRNQTSPKKFLHIVPALRGIS